MRGDGRVFLRKGSAVYAMAFFVNGKEVRETTGQRDETEALKVLRNRLKEVHAAELGGPTFTTSAMQKVSVGELLDSLKLDFEQRGKDSDQVRSGLKIAKETFGHYRAAAFGADHVNEYIAEKLADGYAKASINRILEMVSQSFNLALREGKVAKVPFIKRLSEADNVRTQSCTREQFDVLQANLPADLQDFALFGFLTGWRSGQIKSLEWSHVHERDTIIKARPENVKTRSVHQIPVFGELAEVIKRCRANQAITINGQTVMCKFVFHRKNGDQVGDIRKAWDKARQAAGLKDFRIHDLRSAATSGLTAAGVPQLVAMSITGHKTNSMFRRYNIVVTAEQKDAFAAVEAFHKKKLAEAKTANVVSMQAQQG